MKQMLDELREAIISTDNGKVEELLAKLSTAATYEKVYAESIEPALDALCSSIRKKKGAIPELLTGLKQIRHIAESLSETRAGAKKQRILIGVVEGDIHDMGKNIIRDLCRGYGYEVIDLGRNVAAADFAEASRTRQPDIACLSTMMSTTMEAMGNAVMQIKAVSPDIRVVVGGAFLDRRMAVELAADGYAEDAATVMDELKRVSQ